MNRIKELRTQRGWTQEELGKKINKSSRLVGFYESEERDPDTDTLKLLSDIFGCTIDFLMGRTDIFNSITLLKQQKENSKEEHSNFIDKINRLTDAQKKALDNLLDTMNIENEKEDK